MNNVNKDVLTKDPYYDDEIDLIEIFQKLWKKKITIIGFTIICIIFACVFSIVSPKKYKSTASFFVKSETPQSSLMGYASLLGVSNGSNLSTLIENVINSYSIKINIAKQFEPQFKKSINEFIENSPTQISQDAITSFIISKLNLNKKFSFSINKTNLFELSYISNDKILSKNVLDAYLKQIIAYNERLELSTEKNVFTIIDPPRVPLVAYSPNTKLNLALGAIFGFFLSTCFILIKDQFSSKKNV